MSKRLVTGSMLPLPHFGFSRSSCKTIQDLSPPQSSVILTSLKFILKIHTVHSTNKLKLSSQFKSKDAALPLSQENNELYKYASEIQVLDHEKLMSV